MNRIDTTTPQAKVADYVIELAQPDGRIERVCLSLGPDVPPLSQFLLFLAQQGLIARGGSNPARPERLIREWRQKGNNIVLDCGEAVEADDDLDDPFADGPQKPFRRSPSSSALHLFCHDLEEQARMAEQYPLGAAPAAIVLCQKCRDAQMPNPFCDECDRLTEKAQQQPPQEKPDAFTEQVIEIFGGKLIQDDQSAGGQE